MTPNPGGFGNDDYTQFQRRLLARHHSFATDWLSTAGDVVMLLGLAFAVSGRRKAGAATLSAGSALAAFAHLFQPGTLRDELAAIARHPLWAVRGETHRLMNKVRDHTRSSARIH